MAKSLFDNFAITKNFMPKDTCSLGNNKARA